MTTDEKRYKLEQHGDDPNSEMNIQRRLRWMKQHASEVPVKIPQQWIDEDPALQKAIRLGWIRLLK